ncbi:hypothetical protein [Croceivirga thetidis]|uniref:Uncharacterized protein n=1 Tax=Croceivirga thetidis TaxID=2721623 RepID=A0ABX1GU44_9FLAO|nr:hypothetical protein [Croceivirga thetidis]NKI33470.1 hypothetical protein [Croceivirga thetidis]
MAVVDAIPNVMAEKKDVTQEYGTLKEAYLETYKYKPRKSFTYKEGQRLVLVTSDRTEKTYKLTDHYRTHWKTFLAKDAIGKELRVFLEIDNSRTNPMIVELDGEKIYGKSSMLPINILIILGAVVLTVYNLYQLVEVKKDKTDS